MRVEGILIHDLGPHQTTYLRPRPKLQHGKLLRGFVVPLIHSPDIQVLLKFVRRELTRMFVHESRRIACSSHIALAVHTHGNSKGNNAAKPVYRIPDSRPAPHTDTITRSSLFFTHPNPPPSPAVSHISSHFFYPRFYFLRGGNGMERVTIGPDVI